MVDGEVPGLIQAHDAQRRRDRAPALAVSTSTWFQFNAENQATNSHNPSIKICGTVSTMIEIPPCLLNLAEKPGPALEITMVAKVDDLRERIAAFGFPRGGLEVVRANRSYTLYSRSTGGSVAHLRPTGQSERVQVLWWRIEAWTAPGDFGPVVMPLDQALEFVATEHFFWINA